MATHKVILVPGFFGFGNLGNLSYFLGVREALEGGFTRRALNVRIVEVPTLPTASIRYRAARVLEALHAACERSDGPVHLVGHSTGGLDARLAIAPTASLPTAVEFRAYQQVRTLVTIATPHFGTPLASAFSSFMGKPLLRAAALATAYVLEHGRFPLTVLLKIGEVVTRLDDRVGLRNTVADELYASLLSDLSAERRRQIAEFVEGVTNDQSLLFQLTPAGCDLLNASTADPLGVRYGSVVTRAQPPKVGNLLHHRHDLYAQYLHAVYALLYTLSARTRVGQLPEPVAKQRHALQLGYGQVPNRRDNDGIVPTLSQVWGEVIHCALADHLDVIGHYGGRDARATDTDWLPTRSGFGRAEFAGLWDAVAGFITQRIVDEGTWRENVGRERTALDAAEASLFGAG